MFLRQLIKMSVVLLKGVCVCVKFNYFHIEISTSKQDIRKDSNYVSSS